MQHRRSTRGWAVAALAGTALAAVAATGAGAADWATVLTYNRFGDDGDPYNTIRIEQFEAHLAEIARGGYTVLPAREIIEALRGRRSLPDKTLAITIDDTHASVWRDAWPRLKRAGFPFTVFVATETVDRGAPGYMTWQQLRELRDGGVDFGNMTASHPHLPLQPAARVATEIAAASNRIRDQLGQAPTLFAYPFGEWSGEVRAVVAAAGFAGAFGQQSGVAHTAQDFFVLPRFPMSEAVGSLGRFRIAVGALPLKVTEATPAEPVLAANPPLVGFTLMEHAGDIDRLACFASHVSGPLALQKLGEARVELRLPQPFPPGRGRINCTMPGPDGRWRWLGFQFYQPMER